MANYIPERQDLRLWSQPDDARIYRSHVVITRWVRSLGVVFVRRGLAFYVKSALCSIWFRVRGMQSSLVACDGRVPVLYSSGTVTIGKRLVVRGRVARCEIGADAPNACLQVGERVFINQGATIVASCHIEIGDDSSIGDFAAVYDSNYHRVDPYHPIQSAPVVIGSNVWLGRSVVVLPGSKVGDHTVVAAGSVVKGDLPPRVLAAGSPAQVVRELQIPAGWRRG
jgi:acetyltransferase-like isoleucine patch superfamily enzyme